MERAMSILSVLSSSYSVITAVQTSALSAFSMELSLDQAGGQLNIRLNSW